MNQHLDPERVAALMGGSLPRAERAVMEAHAADCADCLQLLAAMTRTEPPAADSRWRMPVTLRWAVPFAAAATAVALWVNVDRRGREPQPSSPAAATDAVSPPPTTAVSPEPQANQVPAETSTRESRPSPPARKDAGARAQAPLDARLRTGRAASSAEDKRDSALRKEAFSSKPDQTAPAAASPAPAPPAAAPLQQDTLQARERQKAAAPTAARALMATVVDFASPESLVRWQVRGMTVRRSTDAGKTWGSAVVVFHADLLAGSSPAPTVAWVVGRAGAVVLTTDGQSWRRLPFPEAVDLTDVRARNEREADVTTADGRVFRTEDGGQTWTLQETPGSSF